MVGQIKGFPGASDRRSGFVEKLRHFLPAGIVNITGNLVGRECSAVTAGSCCQHPLGS